MYPGILDQLLRFSYFLKSEKYKEFICLKVYFGLYVNILSACLLDFKSGSPVNAILGFALFTFIPPLKQNTVYIEKNGDINFKLGKVLLSAYVLWNSIFAFSSLQLYFGEQVAILISSLLLCYFTGNHNHWYMHRSLTIGMAYFPFERFQISLAIISLINYFFF